MSGYQYPNEVFSYLKKNWKTKIYSGEKIPDLPNDDCLRSIIDTAYLASLQTEENRHAQVRIAYISPNAPWKTYPDCRPLKLQEPRPMNVKEILRLALAGDPTMTMIAVFDSASIGSQCDTPAAIWGFLYLGSELWRFAHGEAQAAFCPPSCLTVSAYRPGHLEISRGGLPLFTLHRGKISGRPIEVLSSGPIRDFLLPSADALLAETLKKLHKRKYEEDYPRNAYFDFLELILLKTREKRHGGTFIIVPDYLTADDSRLTDRIRINYKCAGFDPWSALLEMLVSHWKYFDLSDEMTKASTISEKKFRDYTFEEDNLDDSHKHLADLAGLFASLSSIDGVVVLTDRFRLIGFGSEVTATSPSLNEVKRCLDKNGKKSSTISIEEFGMRHRSALRFCSSYEDSVAFIISQDGQVRAAKRVGPEVLLWEDVTLLET